MKIDMSFLVDTMQKLINTPGLIGYYEKIKPLIEEYANKLGYVVTYDNRDAAYILGK